jgi:hypothetical protein
MWNTTASQSGTQVSVTNATYHATIQAMARCPSDSTAAGTASTMPNSFTLNNATCTVN